jgi:putative Ca2+/H+ antiporter (TMEM165/GDT1 family)
MKFNRIAVWTGAISALVLMTAISCMFGIIVPTLLPRFYTALVVTFIFYFFGIKLLLDWHHMENEGDKEELKEVE